MSSVPSVELGVLGPLQVREDGAPVAVPGAKSRAILTMLGLHNGSIVSADTLIALLWGDDPPRTAAKALQTHISSLRRALGEGVVVTEGTGWTLRGPEVDATRYKLAAKTGRDAAAAGDTSQAVARFEEALALWRGIPELPEGRRGTSEKTRWIEGYAALVEDRAEALLATGRAAELIGELEGAVADAPLRERRWAQLMLALYRAGRQGEALGAYQRARALLAEELGVDPGPDLRRLEAAIVAQDSALETPAVQHVPAVTRAVTFLLTDIEGSTAAWEADADAMAVALARHDELVEQVVTSRGGRLIKTRGEGDATFSVFERPSAAATAAIDLQEAISGEPWALREPMRVRVALHTGEVEFRDGDYFGRAVNRAARLRSLAAGGQILCSGATAELVIDSLPDDVVLADLGTRELRNLARPERVFELRLQDAVDGAAPTPTEAPLERPALPAVLAGPGPFVGRVREIAQLFSAWQTALAGATNALLIAGEPGVGKTRLAGEWSRQAYDQGALVIYGRCDEDLGAPYQPFAEALRSLVPCLGASKLRGLRGVEALLTLVPGLTDVLPDLPAPTRADPDTERYALFDAVVAVLGVASKSAPVVLILDDLHWAAKPTLLLLRHLLRFGEQARVQILGTYRSTDLDRAHPLAATLADLHRDGTANRIALSGLDESDVTAYLAEAGYQDEELARALASVTGGNPFFLIEALRHVDESGGQWDPSTLPQGVREAVSRRLSRLPAEANKALAAAAVVGSRFALELVEHVVGEDLVDAFDEACKAGIVIEEPGGRYRFNHALVRQSLLAELPSVRRMRLHQRIAATLEEQSGADDELLAELAYHYFECAWAGNAAKAVEYCRRAADQAMARLAYEGAADLYDRALHALEEIDDELPDRDEQIAVLLIARCEALLAAGDVASAAGAVSQLQEATRGSDRLAAWATCFDGQLSLLIHPDRLDQAETAVSAAAVRLAELGDTAGEAKAHTVRAGCLARLGRIGDCEVALDDALTEARRAREHRRVNSVLANAPLAALWGPNPVPRAGGRCLDVVRLLRITTESPAVEATSTRCQAVLEAFRGRAAAARRMIDSARRTVTELGLRHALFEVEQFAGIVELVAGDPAAAEPHLRQAYNGFRRMRLDADTAETAALLGRTCLALDREDEADELCTESERLAGHALKPSIAWRVLRAQLLSRGHAHDEARRVAEAAVSRAERTDGLVDHGDACLCLATVLAAAGDAAGSRAAAERAVALYEQKGAAALAEKALHIVGNANLRQQPHREAGFIEPTNSCAQAVSRMADAVNREAWDEVAQLLAPSVSVESRRRIVGFARMDVPSNQWPEDMKRYLETGVVRYHPTALAVRGDRFVLFRLELGTSDLSSGAPQDEELQVVGLDDEGRLALQVKFDVEDIDAALAELDAQHNAVTEQENPRALDHPCARAIGLVIDAIDRGAWDELEELHTPHRFESRRKVIGFTHDNLSASDVRAMFENSATQLRHTIIAVRGERLALARLEVGTAEESPGAPHDVILHLIGLDEGGRIALEMLFDVEDIDAALAELDAQHSAATPTEAVTAEPDNACARLIRRSLAAVDRGAWDDLEEVGGPHRVESRRKIVGFARDDVSFIDLKRMVESGALRFQITVIAVRGERLALGRLQIATDDLSPGAPHDEMLQLIGLDEDGRVALDIFFDIEDIDAAIAELDAAHARYEQERPRSPLENAASRADDRVNALFAERRWDEIDALLGDDVRVEDRRRGLRREGDDHAEEVANARVIADIGVKTITSQVLAIRGQRLALTRTVFSGRDQRPEAFHTEILRIAEIDADERIAAYVAFDLDDFDAAMAELDARYLAGEAAPYANTWSALAGAYAALNRHEIPATPDWVNVDHRRATTVVPGDMAASIRATWDVAPNIRRSIEAVHRLDNVGAVITHKAHGTSQEGFDAEWRLVALLTFRDDLISRAELFDEADLDAALARFDQLSRPAPQLGNAANRVADRLMAHFAAREWDAMIQLLTNDFSNDDRRRVVNAGTRRGRDGVVKDARANADLGVKDVTATVVATRGERLVLRRERYSGSAQPEAFHADVLSIYEINADERIAALVTLDPEDFDAAIAELDARYLTGEAADHAQTWSAIARAYSSIAGGELPATTPDWINVDHRRAAAFAPGDAIAYIRAAWDLTEDLNLYVENVYRLNDLGAVVAHASHGTSHDGFDAEWRWVNIFAVDGDRISRTEMFDEADLDTALAKFDQLSRRAPQVQNAAFQVADRFVQHFAAAEWDAMGEMLADNFSSDDRRRVVGAGVRHGREAEILDMQAISDLWISNITSSIVATRGTRLVLVRARFSDRDHGAEAFLTDVLGMVEINADEKILALISFDADDLKAAIAELDARYVAGEAADHAHTWSLVTAALASINRHELPELTTDWVNIDHRRGASFATGDMTAYIHDLWDDAPDIDVYSEVVHRLSNLGAVITQTAHGTSQRGFQAEWREIGIFMFDGDLLSRFELFDETDLDAALARFDQLSRPAPKLENAASQVAERFLTCFAARDWNAMAELVADDFSSDDRRAVIGAGIRLGPGAVIEEMRANADLWITKGTFTVIATRGERLGLSHARFSGSDQGPQAFITETLAIGEINADGRIVAFVTFDLDDFEAAIEELDARFLAGEGAAHANTWSVIAAARAALVRHELPPTTPDWVNIDHRRGIAFSPGDFTAYFRAAWDREEIVSSYIDALYQLNDLGAVFTQVVKTTSQDGFDGEWRLAELMTVEGGLVDRAEFFDETDLDAALAKFEQLSGPTPWLGNAASQVAERFRENLEAGNWDGMAAILADDFSADDRRRLVGAGVRTGREAQIMNMQAIAGLYNANMTSTDIAVRGERLVLSRYGFLECDQKPDAFRTDMLCITEIDADQRIVASVAFDLDDFEAAIAELDARYLAGEAAAHAHTWSVITRGHAILNRRELPPTTTDLVSIDHRRGAAFAPGEGIAYLRAGFDVGQDIQTYVEVVHRLSDLGAVCTHVGYGISREGFDAEWRGIDLLTVDGDSVNRLEVFGEADLDAALAAFDQLSPPTPRLENAASQIADRVMAHFTAREWDAAAAMVADGFSSDDRRRTVNAGIQRGRGAAMKDALANAGVGAKEVTSAVIATRGERLVLRRARYSSSAQHPEAFYVEALIIYEINADGQLAAGVIFDIEDIDAAFEELDRRYLAGEAAAYSRTWSVISKARAALTRRELFPTTPDWVNIDHRKGIAFTPDDPMAYVRSAWNLLSDGGVYIESAHRLTNLGAVVTWAGHATSREGSDVEFRGINVLTVKGDLISRCEIFDEADLDAALARFEELHLQPRPLENAASQADERFWMSFTARQWAAMAELVANNIFADDRRRVVNAGIRHGRDDYMADMRAVAEVFPDEEITSTVMATRGARHALTRICASHHGPGAGEISTEVLSVVELDADNRVVSRVAFDIEDIDAAFEELDARYVAGEAAVHAQTWLVITRAYAAMNRHELPATSPDWKNIDHRRGIAFAPGEATAYLRASQDPQGSVHIETVHRLSNLGAAFTWAGHGTSQEGFEAEWRGINVVTVEGDLIDRGEIFDEADLDAALARFEELRPQTRRLENAARRVWERFEACLAAGDWEAMTGMAAEDVVTDDRRRVVGAGLQLGRDVNLANIRATLDIGIENVTCSAIAIRGERLVLDRLRFSGHDQAPEPFHSEILRVLEIDAEERLAAAILFDPDDIDAALEEIDARYIAGEAAGHAHAWSAIAGSYAAVNRHEVPATTTDFAIVDHRPIATFAGDLTAFLNATWDLTAQASIYLGFVHRLNDLGAVVTHAAHATSQEGLDVEWHEISLLTVNGGVVDRCEIFDEADLDAALARLEELQALTPRLGNAASRASERFLRHFVAGGWDAMAEILADDYSLDDRRRVVGAGVRHGRDAQIADMGAIAEVWTKNVTSTVVALRGERLALVCVRHADGDKQAGAFHTDALVVGEINEDERIVGAVSFDLDDVDAAFEELDRRYLGGEAAAHAHTWSVIADMYAQFNRHERPSATPDWIHVDHRALISTDASELPAHIRVGWDLMPHLSISMETVHRLTDLGAVVTHLARGVTQEEIEVEWRMVMIFTVDGDCINRCEMFDEADLDAALVRFGELSIE